MEDDQLESEKGKSSISPMAMSSHHATSRRDAISSKHHETELEAYDPFTEEQKAEIRARMFAYKD